MPRNSNNDKPLGLQTLLKRLNYGSDKARSRQEDGRIFNDRLRVFRSSFSNAKTPGQWNSSDHRAVLKRLAENFLVEHGEHLWPDDESQLNYNPTLTYSRHASTIIPLLEQLFFQKNVKDRDANKGKRRAEGELAGEANTPKRKALRQDESPSVKRWLVQKPIGAAQPQSPPGGPSARGSSGIDEPISIDDEPDNPFESDDELPTLDSLDRSSTAMPSPATATAAAPGDITPRTPVRPERIQPTSVTTDRAFTPRSPTVPLANLIPEPIGRGLVVPIRAPTADMDAQEDASPTTIIDASPASAPERQPAQGIAQIAPRLESSYTVIRSRVPYDARIWTPKEDRAFKTLAALKTDLPLNLDVLAGGLKFELFQGRNRVDAVVPLDSEDDFQATMRGFNAHIRKWMRVYQGTDKTIVIDMTIEQLSDIGEAKLEDEDDTQYALPFGSPNRGS